MTGDLATIKKMADRETVDLMLGSKCLNRFPSQILRHQIVDLAGVEAAMNLLWGSKFGLGRALRVEIEELPNAFYLVSVV